MLELKFDVKKQVNAIDELISRTVAFVNRYICTCMYRKGNDLLMLLMYQTKIIYHCIECAMCNVRLPLDICASVTMTNKPLTYIRFQSWLMLE